MLVCNLITPSRHDIINVCFSINDEIRALDASLRYLWPDQNPFVASQKKSCLSNDLLIRHNFDSSRALWTPNVYVGTLMESEPER